MLARHLKRALLCVLLGLLTTVAVAWGCAWIDVDQIEPIRGVGGRAYHENFPVALGASRHEAPGALCIATSRLVLMHGEGPPIALPAPFRSFDEVIAGWTRPIVMRDILNDLWDSPAGPVIDARGWPCLALWCEHTPDPSASTLAAIVAGGFIIESASLPKRPGLSSPAGAFPCRPLWRGLLINTAVYGSAWWLLLCGVPLARRALRRRRGRCPRCGYSLAGLPADSACPECGT